MIWQAKLKNSMYTCEFLFVFNTYHKLAYLKYVLNSVKRYLMVFGFQNGERTGFYMGLALAVIMPVIRICISMGRLIEWNNWRDLFTC